jgi:NADH-quinone oxidoreductase subunit D
VIEDDESQQVARSMRGMLVHIQEVVTGGRVHPMFTRVGGVASPISADALTDYEHLITDLTAELPRIEDAVLSYASHLGGLAVLTREQAIGYGTSGSVARASGVDLDLRRDDPYLAYEDVVDNLAVALRTTGDAQARYEVLVAQVPSSLAIMSACVDRLRSLGEGPIDVPLPKTVRAPEGETYRWIEGPLGITGCLLASVGDSLPWRMKIRSASFANAQCMVPALVGTPVEQLADAVMSFFFVVGDIDR